MVVYLSSLLSHAFLFADLLVCHPYSFLMQSCFLFLSLTLVRSNISAPYNLWTLAHNALHSPCYYGFQPHLLHANI